MKQYFLGIDNGGTVTKAALYDVKGKEIASYAKQAHIIMPKEGYVERDLYELSDSIKQCIQGVIANATIHPKEITAVSTSCYGKGLYLIDENGLPAYNGIISSDSRTRSLVKELKNTHLNKKLYEVSFQQLWTGHPISLLKWFSLNYPDLLQSTKHIFMGHDYIRYYLTGEIHAETTNMSGSGLVDVKRKHYSDELIASFDLSSITHALPPLIESTDCCGYIIKNISDETGLLYGTPVYGGFFDVVASAISSGLINNRAINATMGTWAVATCISDTITHHEYPYIWGNYCIENTYFAHEGSPTSASNLDWCIKNLLNKDISIDICNTMVHNAIDDNTLLFFPFLYASNISDTMHASLIGLKSHHTISDILKSVYEGILFSHKMHLERLYGIVPIIEHISFVGGPTHSHVWMQMCADIMNAVICIPDCEEAGCKGAALAAMVGHNVYSNFEEAVQNTVQFKKSFSPRTEKSSYYHDKYEYYKKVGSILK